MTDQHFVLDDVNTVISFDVRWFGILHVRGTFRRLHGTLELDEADVTSARVRIDVDAASVHTGLALRDLHLRGPRFLHADLHPYISFKSLAVRRAPGRLVVDGTLSLRGVEVTVHSDCPLDGVDGERPTVELCGRFEVSRRQFDVGVPRGLAARNPLFLAIADTVHVNVRMTVPSHRLLPALSPGAA